MKYLLRCSPSVIWMGVIFYLSSRTGDDLGGWLPFFRQFIPGLESFDVGHFFAYFILAITYAWAFPPHKLTWKGKLRVILLCLLYGVTDEYHQSFVPGRTPDWHDLRNDGIGALLAMLFISIPFVRKRFSL
nr:VanZ family protein [Paenibacillus hamazuiensis]